MEILALADVAGPPDTSVARLLGQAIGISFVFGGLPTGLVGRARGRSFWGWVVVGMLLSPILGIILALVLPPVENPVRTLRSRRHGGHRGAGRPGGRTGRRSPAGRGDRLSGMGNWSEAHGEAPEPGGSPAEPPAPARAAPRSARDPGRVPRRAPARPPAARVPPPVPPTITGPAPEPPQEPSPPAFEGLGSYWIDTKSGRKGPFTPARLRKLVDQGRIPRTISVVDSESGLRIEVNDLLG